MHCKRIVLLTIVLILGMFVNGCESQMPVEVSTDLEISPQYHIGISFDSFVIERWIRDRDAFVSTAQQLGAEVNVQNANGSLEEQRSQIDYFIKKKMDVIVVIAVDCDGLNTEIEKARKAGIKIISYDRLIKNADTDLYISFDNEKVGIEMARLMVKTLPNGGSIACINGPESDNNVLQVREGYSSILSNSKVNIAYSANCENWDADEAPILTEEAIEEVPDLAGIICGNDDIAMQVFKTLAEYRMAGDVILVGQDADLSACQRIVEGTQKMTVFKEVESLASIAAIFAVELAKNENIENSQDVSLGYYAELAINNGKNEIPYYKLEPVVVTKDNIDSVIIDSGFHSKEEVYLNVD